MEGASLLMTAVSKDCVEAGCVVQLMIDAGPSEALLIFWHREQLPLAGEAACSARG